MYGGLPEILATRSSNIGAVLLPLQFINENKGLRRGDGALLQCDIIHQRRSRFDQTLSILEANSFVTKGLRRGDDGLHLLADNHVCDHFVETRNHGRRAQFEE